jgi:DNA-binding transcriptional ArsR family regulator
MVDYVTPALVAASAFFVTVSFGLLYRYRQVSQKMSESTDLGRDLWSSLEQRMKKQDERILDIMTRFDVVQSRVVSNQLAQVASSVPAVQPATSVPPSTPQTPVESVHADVTTPEEADRMSRHVAPAQESQESQSPPISPPEPKAAGVELKLDETQLAAIKLLAQKAMNTRDITDALGKSREHTARVMKILFESGLVVRDDSNKPFVYEITDEGRRYLQSR